MPKNGGKRVVQKTTKISFVKIGLFKVFGDF